MLYFASTQQLNLFQKAFGTTASTQIGSILALAAIFAMLYRFALSYVIRWTLDMLDYRRLQKRKLVFLELTPPASNTKTALATAQLHAGLHGLLCKMASGDRLWRRKHIISLEIVTTRENGIRYIATLDPSDVEMFKHLLISYLPSVAIREVDDYLPYASPHSPVTIGDYKQAGHFAVPLVSHDQFDQHDPIAYITGALTRPLPDELLSFQLVLSRADRRTISKVRHQLLHGKDSVSRYSWWAYPLIIALKLLHFFLGILGFVLALIGGDSSDVQYGKRNELSPRTQHVIDAIHSKLDQPLFDVNVRALAVGPNSNRRLQSFANSLHMLHMPGYQGLVSRGRFPNKWKYPYEMRAFSERLPSMFTSNSNVLAASELAALYHFPYGEYNSTENLVTSFSKTLAAPVAVKQHADREIFDVVLGVNEHHGSKVPIGLTAAERERHVYVIGGTGNGKTTMLQYELMQDIQNGKGVAIIDPHGDLAEMLLRYIPDERLQDVIYFNPRDIAHPIGLNLLEQPEGLSEDELLLERDFITESVVSVFRKIFSEDDSGGHRIEHFLRNTIHTAFTVPDATLFTVYKLLTNTKFRNSVTRKLTDEDLIDFWKGEFNQAGDYQKVKMSSGVNAKLGRFQRSVVSRRILEQPKSTIDFDDIIQNNKILICNFSKGHIGEDTSTLLGISVMTKLQLAALRRSRLGQGERTPFYLYVDEFQNFATTSFVQLLSEARKYKLFLTMAEQSTAQQEERRFVDIILANVGTVISFRSGSPVDEELLLPLFSPYVQKGEIANLSAFNFYARLSGIKAQEPMSGITVVMQDQGSQDQAKRVIESSQKLYAKSLDKDKSVEPIAKQTKKQSTTKRRTSNQATRNDRELKAIKPVA
ncbi:MAG TPA: DUF87 domain-containing protein [Candidatus Saccharimonadales bacterium]|nr:DUF87 domain-containing protein [Candidatus Saccharimonadales bacterium]